MAACSAAARSGRFGSFSEKLRQRQVAENAGEQVVEVVGDTAGHLADHFHLLRLAELFLELKFLGDVVDEHEFCGPAVHGQVEGGDLHVDDRAVLGAVPPQTGRLRLALSRRGALADVVDGHPEELAARVAVLVDGGVVDGEEAERLAIEDPHRVRVRIEEQAVALLAAPEGVRGGAAIGDVALDHDPVGGAAVGVRAPARGSDRPRSRCRPCGSCAARRESGWPWSSASRICSSVAGSESGPRRKCSDRPTTSVRSYPVMLQKASLT